MRGDTKVILSIIAMLVFLTACLHFGEKWVSQDIRHIKQIPTIINDLMLEPPPRVLFLSNSLTHEGIQPEVIAPIWAANGLSASIGRIYPDDTNIADWTYLYRGYVQAVDAPIDTLVLTFANDQLSDTTPNFERLGEFGGWSLAPAAFANDVTSLSGRIRYLLGATSTLWRNKERVQTRVLALLPGYKSFAVDLNRAREAEHVEPAGQPTYNRLTRFLCMVPAATKVVFVASPLPTIYYLPPGLRATIAAHGADLINMQGLVGPLTPDDFPDGYHLSDEAAARFSKALAIKLKPIVSKSTRETECGFLRS